MNNSAGIVGTNPNVKIMALRAWSGNTLTTANIIKAVQFAQHNGARIINASFGGSAYDPALETAMQNFPGIIVTAAGNGSIDGVGFEITWGNPIYPCAFNLSNSLCIAATDSNDALTPYSNFSPIYVDLAAPCSTVIGTYGTTQYAFASGTSSAVPFTVGIASLVWSMYPEASLDQVLDAIISWAVYLDVLEDKTIYPSRVDLYGSLLYITSLFAVDPFDFDTITGALPNTLYTSNIVEISGMEQAVPISVSTGEYRINEWVWSGADQPWIIQSGDTLELRILSSWESNSTDEAIITVGGYSTSFTVTTINSLPFGEDVYFTGDRRHYNETW
jgi:subtilisin family serine protease